MFPLLIRLSAFLVALGLFVYLYRKVRFRKRCPACGYDYPDRTVRRGIVKYLPVKAYFCSACRHRFIVVDLLPETRVHQNTRS